MECGNALLKNNYNIKIFNTINFKKSILGIDQKEKQHQREVSSTR